MAWPRACSRGGRRTREIGIRIALGAAPWRIVAAVFRRRLSQVSLGVVVGAAVVGAAAVFLAGYRPDEPWAYAGGLSLLVAYAAFMLGVCLLASIMPTQRAQRPAA